MRSGYREGIAVGQHNRVSRSVVGLAAQPSPGNLAAEPCWRQILDNGEGGWLKARLMLGVKAVGRAADHAALRTAAREDCSDRVRMPRTQRSLRRTPISFFSTAGAERRDAAGSSRSITLRRL